jgi:hypothetical protein
MTKKKTSKEDALEWAQKAYDKLKNKQPPKYRSTLEKNIADLLEGLGVSFQYESEKLGYTIEHHYTPDFVLPNYTYLEAKGYWDAADRRKILAVKKANPEVDIRMVFQSPYNTISKKSKTTYAKWCDRHDIPWTSYKDIPIDWLV